jgi:hypothetical protein
MSDAVAGPQGPRVCDGQAGRLIIEHGDDARRVLHREVYRTGPTAERLRVDRHLEAAGLTVLEQVGAFA